MILVEPPSSKIDGREGRGWSEEEIEMTSCDPSFRKAVYFVLSYFLYIVIISPAVIYTLNQ